MPLVSAGLIKAKDFLGSQFQADLGHITHQIRIGIRAKFRTAIPTDIRLQNDSLSLLDKTFHPAHLGDALLEHLHGRPAINGDHIQRLGGFGCLFSGKEGIFPNGCSRHGGCAHYCRLQKISSVHICANIFYVPRRSCFITFFHEMSSLLNIF